MYVIININNIYTRKLIYFLLKQQFLDNRLGWLVEKFNFPADWTVAKVKTLCNPSTK